MNMGDDFFMAKVSELEIWPRAEELVPALSQSEYGALKASIKQNGIQTPLSVVKPGSKFAVLDGASRFAIARELEIPEVPAQLVPLSPDEYPAFCLLQAAKKESLNAGQRAALAVLLNRELVMLKKHAASWRAFQKWLPGGTQEINVKTRQIAATHFEVSVGYISLAGKILKHAPETFRLLHQGRISMSQAEKSISDMSHDGTRQDHRENCSIEELEAALDQAEERIRELEDGRERIRKHLEIILPFARRALKGESIQAKYRFVLRPVPGNTLSETVENAEALKDQLSKLKREVAELEAENLLLAVRNDDPQQLMLVHSLCLLKSSFDVPVVQDSLDALKTLPVITRDAVDEFFRLLTRVINFSSEFISQLRRISLTTPAHLNETARDELMKYVEGRPAETAFEVPALRNTARQQLVIYTRSGRRDCHNYPVKADNSEE